MRHESQNFHFLFRMDFGRAVTVVTPAVSKIQIRERGNRSLPDFLEEAFAQQFPVIFIGALGIAVRAIAPLIRHKTVDSPVLVLDEAGQFVIPVLSGHLGGANELAQQIAESLHSAAVVTTATDVNGLFAVDVFARKNGLRVCNPKRSGMCLENCYRVKSL